jgi:uncharacterized membrane protein
MTLYLLAKFVHVLLAIVAVGSNVTYAIWLRRAGHDRDRIVFAVEGVRYVDRRLANPAYILLLLSGITVALLGDWSFQRGWLATAIGLYVATAVIGFTVFAPAIRRQLREAEADAASPTYEAAARRTTILALTVTAIVVVIVFLMVTKPF